ncbi:hypothetical protein M3Y99_01693300 [Aphelenchoides fujianensis]|nr:hypothetical protein M3Y99_01693300 [Aphelenchoides fujianensis]
MTTVGLRLSLGNGEERREILGRATAFYPRGDTITFVRLNVAEVWAEVEHTTDVPFFGPRAFQWSNDGREVCAFEVSHPRKLHVYSLEQKKWTEEAMAEGSPAAQVN